MKFGNKQKVLSNFDDELIITSTFNVNHFNYIGKRLKAMRKIQYIILLFACIPFLAFPFFPNVFLELFNMLVFFLPYSILMVIVLLWFMSLVILSLYYIEKKIREYTKELQLDTLVTEGLIKSESSNIHGGYVELENFSEKFLVDATFIRRTQKGQRVRIIYTPHLKLVKAWGVLYQDKEIN
jgi:hypothetical protein